MDEKKIVYIFISIIFGSAFLFFLIHGIVDQIKKDWVTLAGGLTNNYISPIFVLSPLFKYILALICLTIALYALNKYAKLLKRK